MDLSATKYIVISPVRDEEAYLRFTIESMVRQTIVPTAWIIVNDGSTDNTGAIIDEYPARYPWIHAVHRTNRGFRKAGGGVVDAFNDGYNALPIKDWDFIVGNSTGTFPLTQTTFKSVSPILNREAQLGVGGGVMVYIENGKKSFEANPKFHVRGATKIYRRACWNATSAVFGQLLVGTPWMK